MGAKIDEANQVADFTKLGVHGFPLIRAAGGRPGVSLFDYPDPSALDAEFQVSPPGNGPEGIDTDKIGPAEVLTARVQERARI